MNAEEKRHIARVVALGCCMCKRMGIEDSIAECHHVRQGRLGKRNHMAVIGLCPTHHRNGKLAIHTLGKRSWETIFGTTEQELLDEVNACVGKVEML
jgi:hypothetical protein